LFFRNNKKGTPIIKEPLDERIEGMSKEEMITGLIEVPQKQASMLLEAGYLLMELGKNKEAEETFQGVAALLPHSEVPHMALGHLYFSQGKFKRIYILELYFQIHQ
jgi:predicted Zn-dependent protease